MQTMDQYVLGHIQDTVHSALSKLKAGQDYGPEGHVVLSTNEATLLYRLLTEGFGERRISIDPTRKPIEYEVLAKDPTESAMRWDTLMSSARMHYMGSSGIDFLGDDENSVPRIRSRPTATHVHFGMEFWSKYNDDFNSGQDRDNQLCHRILTMYTDKKSKPA